jgi:hypothetical protein
VSKCLSWSDVVARVRHLLEARGDPVSDALLGNLKDIVELAQAGVALPEVGIGYWPTATLGWPSLTLEIFEDRIEVYPPTPPGKAITVWGEPHTPGQAFSEAFKTAVLNAEGPIRDAIR